ncbi:MAG: tRNA lysidine(34) synthetase TilS [Victivallales bacterium]|nr:tRNA lysidine(34) synthetase TilS [Victivallales bacterium]
MNPCEAIRAFQAEPDWAYVGFSGGADSTALLLAMVQGGWKVTAVHFNHHLRGAESDADELWCRKFCEERHVRLKVFDLWVEQDRQPGEGIEECARRLRLEVWKRLVKDEWRPIFLAHHADDCLEELFLRLGRGSNASGLVSLRPERFLGDGLAIMRPLLECRKRDLEDFLRDNHVRDWRVDHTNLEADSSRRNAIRNRLVPLAREIFGQEAGFFAALESLRDDAQFLEDEAAARLKAAGEKPALEFWRELPSALLVRALRKWAGLPLPPSRMTIHRLQQALADGKSALVPLGTEQWIRVSRNGLAVVNNGAAEPLPPTKWRWSRPPRKLEWKGVGVFRARNISPYHWEDDGEIFDDRILPKELTIRTMQPGDVMQPFGGEHHRKVADLFKDHHITPEDRRNWPLVCAGDAIIWIPGVCRAEFGEVSDASIGAVHLTFSKA